jgi:hypothetical protein
MLFLLSSYIKREMITNFELEDIANSRDLDLIGVFSKDDLPIKKISGSYIINLQNQDDGNGTHWVVFKIFSNRDCCYFDSFGMPMPQEVNNWLSKFKPIATNNRQIQDIKSQLCGYFCLAFIEYFNDIDPDKEDIFEKYDDFLNCFSANQKTNDKIVKQLLEKYK